MKPSWKEIFRGGSPGTEQALFRTMAQEMSKLRQRAADRPAQARMMYAKTVAGVTNASLIMDRILPADLAVGHFQPGASL